MPDQRSSIESEAHAYLDRAVLGLLLDIDKQRPWSETEIARAYVDYANYYFDARRRAPEGAPGAVS